MPADTTRNEASQNVLAHGLRRLFGSSALAFLRPVIRPLRPAAASLGLVAPAPGDELRDSSVWTPAQLHAWYARPGVSGMPGPAVANARRLIDDAVPSPGLYLAIGDVLVRHRELNAALEAFRRAHTVDENARFHLGQTLLDFILQETPTPAELLSISSLAARPGAMVPDLAKAVLGGLLNQDPATGGPELAAAIAGVAAITPRGAVLDLGNVALANGEHGRALAGYELALRSDPQDILTRVQMGVTEFLAGRYEAAERHFAVMEVMRRAEKARWGVTDASVTVMHETWVQAIGHIAHLDTYVKAMRLGWIPEQRSVLAFDSKRPPTGWPLLKHWARHLEVVSSARDLSDVLDERIFGQSYGLPREDRDRRRAALMSFFWSGPAGDGQVRWYGPFGSAVQHAWRDAGHGPLLSVTDDEQDQFRTLMHQLFGLPKGAWFALLHVREAGYKTQWEAVHAYTRNANIEAYDEAVQRIIDRGGWVIRGGDPSMRPIRPRPNVIDYATSPYRTPDLDILLCANCRFFLGTNSGFSLVPPLFGRPCALTNWSPLATPNWYPEDIVVPKLVRRRGTSELLSFDEMLRTSAGRSQFQRDFQGEFEKLDNSPEDLTAAVDEMLDELDGTLVATREELARRAKYDAIAQAADVYPGSRMGLRFLTKYAQLL